jgi:hypothetical protein
VKGHRRAVAIDGWSRAIYVSRTRPYRIRQLIVLGDKLKAARRRATGLTAMRSKYGPPQRRKKGRR